MEPEDQNLQHDKRTNHSLKKSAGSGLICLGLKLGFVWLKVTSLVANLSQVLDLRIF
jgi:hypothetical protein